MMGMLYRILAKAIASRLSLLLRTIHTSQSGFIGGRSIYDNILAVQLGIEHAQTSQQDMFLMQLDVNKAFNFVNWTFIHQNMLKMGFGPRMASIIFLLGQDAKSSVLLNGLLTSAICIKCSARQRFPLSPLLFAMATHPLYCMLESLSDIGVLHGLQVQNCNISDLGFAYDISMFLKTTNHNFSTFLVLLGMYGDVADLTLNLSRSILVDLLA